MNLINGIETDFRFAGIDKFDVNNGNGVGATLFVQGCSHHCKGCHNQSTWDKSKGIPFTQSIYDELFNELSKSIFLGLLFLVVIHWIMWSFHIL